MTATPVRIEDLGVRDIANGVATGKLRPIDVVEAAIQRIQALDPKVQAWSYLDLDAARADAEALTREAEAGKLRGPLHGVPYGIKDEFHVKGMPTGMRNLDDPPMEPEDATCVARLREAGAVVLGKTYMPVGRRPMPARNPWNLEHTPGGTSSGSGAAVGARMVPVAIGEQTAGSNLRPAAYCGASAIKPTYGRISRFGCVVFAWSMDHPGIIARNMEDVALVLSVVAGPDAKDPTTLPEPAPPADLRMDEYRPPRIGLVRNFFLEQCEPVMRDAVEGAASRLAKAGATVEDVLLPKEFALAWEIHRIIGASEGSTLHARRHADPNVLEADLPSSGGRAGSLIPVGYYLQARRIRAWLRAKLRDETFSRYDAILMPATPAPAPKAQGRSTGNATLLICWSVLGLPAITIPAGLSPDGLPLGLQFVTRAGSDYELMRVGAWSERVLGYLPPPPL